MTVFAKDEMVACIKAELDAQGISQAQFAKMIGRTEKHVSQVMTGKAGTVELDYWAFVLGKRFDVRMVPLVQLVADVSSHNPQVAATPENVEEPT